MKNTLYLIIALSVLMSGCEFDVDAGDLIDEEEKVVIKGFLAPQDELLKVQVSRAIPLIGETFSGSFDDIQERLILKNAIVTLSDEDQKEVQLRYSDDNFSYQIPAAEFPVIAGKNYFLTVKVQGKIFKSRCRIPEGKVQDIRVEILSKVSNTGSLQGNIIPALAIKFVDIKDKDNFYIIGGSAFCDLDDLTRETIANFRANRFLTDVMEDGELISSLGLLEGNRSCFTDIEKVFVQVANVEKSLYESFRASYVINETDSNPIAETVIPPNNIEGEGGFGIFAGYQLTEEEVIIE